MEIDDLAGAIVRDPDDVELQRVYADALQEHGDPRGEHIALAFQAEHGDHYAATRVRMVERAAERKLAHGFGDDLVVRVRWRRGFVEHVDIDARRPVARLPLAKLQKLLARPELLALRSIDLRGTWPREQAVGRTLADLEKLVEGRRIRGLGLGNAALGSAELARLFVAMPELRGLALTTSEPASALAAINTHAHLIDIDFGSREMPQRKLIEALVHGLSRDLECLQIHGVDGLVVKAFAPILDLSAFPRLRQLGVMAAEKLTYDLWRALEKSPLLHELEAFGFCAGSMYDDEISMRWLVDHAHAFAHVRLFTSALWPPDENGAHSERLGLILKTLGRHADAIPELEHHLDFSGAEPDHRACWEELGEALLEAGRAEEALAPLDRAVELFKDRVTDESIGTYQTRGQTLDALELFEEASVIWRRVLKRDRQDAWTLRWHARALHELGQHRKALATLDDSLTYGAHDYDPSERLAWGHLLRGRMLWDQRRIDDALEELSIARTHSDDGVTSHVGTTPRDAALEAWWVQGRIERQRDNLPAARTCLEQALAGPLVKLAAAYELGLVLFDLGELSAAHATWQRAAEAGHWEDRDDQAHALLALGKPAEALAQLEAARHDKGGARACALHALGRLDDAIIALDDYAHRPRLPEPTCVYRHLAGALLQGLVHRSAGRAADAQPLLARARPATRDPAKLHAALAKQLHITGSCKPDRCGRSAAVVAMAAASALGDRDDAIARGRAITDAIAAGRGGLVTPRLWELRSALPFLGKDAALVASVLGAVELCKHVDIPY